MSEIYKLVNSDDSIEDWFIQDESDTYRSNMEVEPRIIEGIKSINQATLGINDGEPDMDMLYFYGILMVIGLRLSDEVVIQKYFGEDISSLSLEKRINVGIRTYLTESGEIGDSEEMYNVALSLSRLACFVKKDTSGAEWKAQSSLRQALDSFGVNQLAGRQLIKAINDELELAGVSSV